MLVLSFNCYGHRVGLFLNHNGLSPIIQAIIKGFSSRWANRPLDRVLQQAYTVNWEVHCEPSLASADHVVRYLGQYTHRVAITNQRLLSIAAGKVTFMAKDYRRSGIKRPVTLDGVAFLRRFTLHILPHRFVKIRRFGIYNHTLKRNRSLRFVPEKKPAIEALEKRLLKESSAVETSMERLERLTGINPCRCPVCKTGRMVTIRTLPRIRSPGGMTASRYVTGNIASI